MNTILIKDQTIGGKGINHIELEFKNQVITIKDLIKKRVKTEVDIYNKMADTPYYGLVIPDKIEKFLNKDHKSNDRKEVDLEKQVYVALDGFLKNQFFVIIDNKQADSLEQEINIQSVKEIEFIKLTPLVGG